MKAHLLKMTLRPLFIGQLNDFFLISTVIEVYS